MRLKVVDSLAVLDLVKETFDGGQGGLKLSGGALRTKKVLIENKRKTSIAMIIAILSNTFDMILRRILYISIRMSRNNVRIGNFAFPISQSVVRRVLGIWLRCHTHSMLSFPGIESSGPCIEPDFLVTTSAS